jgi:Ca-activated chloride channel family protein
MTLKLRYKEPSSETSKLLSRPILDRNAGYDQASEDTRFGAAVALFGMLLGRSEHTLEVGYPLVLELAEEAVGPDPGGYRRELLDLVRRAQELDSQS